MKERTLRWLLVFSLVLNLAIVAIIAYDYYVRAFPGLVPWIVLLTLAIILIAFVDLTARRTE